MEFRTTHFRKHSGVVLVDMLVGLGISGIILATLMSVSLSSARSFATMSNYSEMSADSRLALDTMAQEIRNSKGVVDCTGDSITLIDSRTNEFTFRFDEPTRTVLRVLIVAGLFWVVVLALIALTPLLIQILVAGFVAVAADSVVHHLQSRGMRRGHAIATVMLGAITVLALLAAGSLLLGNIGGDYNWMATSLTSSCRCEDNAACAAYVDRAPDKGHVRHEL